MGGLVCRLLTRCSVTFLILVATLGLDSSASAWDNKTTHKDLSKAATEQSILDKQGYLNTLGMTEGLKTKLTGPGGTSPSQEIYDWIQDGADFEDAAPRPLNHFHDPVGHTMALPWANAGLNDWSTGDSAILWAQSQTNTEWSWDAVRLKYYQGLTATTPSDRESYLAQTFRGLGHLIHLVQDMSQPAHVRNDAHLEDYLGGILNNRWFERLENWAKAYNDVARGFMTAVPPTIPPQKFTQSAEPGLVPITAFWDTDTFTLDSPAPPTGTDVGLAEYVNGSFFSDSTIGAPVGSLHYYRFPLVQDPSYHRCEAPTPTGLIGVKRYYLSRSPCPTDGTPLEPFLTEKFFYNPNTGEHDYFLNDLVYEDYARKLLPLAVGYSAALIDYFFRDDIEITPPERAVYGLTGPTGAFQEIKLKAKAALTTGDALTNGAITLVVVYRPAQANPYQANLTDIVPRGDFVSIAVPEQNNIRAIPADTPVELSFDLSNTPLPLWATDVHIQVVYKGAIGSWPDAVAVGAKDLSEPTPIDLINTMDYSCLNNNYVRSGTPEAVAEAGTNTSWDIYPHQLNNVSAPSSSVYVKFSSLGAPQMASPSPSLHDASVETLDPATYGRIFILIDSPIYWSTYAPIVRLDGRDGDSHLLPYTTLEAAGPLKNQDEVVDGQPVTYFSVLRLVRGVPVWWGIPYRNRSYPVNDPCPENVMRNATPNATGPVAVQFP